MNFKNIKEFAFTEFAVGSVFEDILSGEMLRVVEDTDGCGCDVCACAGRCPMMYSAPLCTPSTRSDRKSVYFERVQNQCK